MNSTQQLINDFNKDTGGLRTEWLRLSKDPRFKSILSLSLLKMREFSTNNPMSQCPHIFAAQSGASKAIDLLISNILTTPTKENPFPDEVPDEEITVNRFTAEF